MSELRVGLIGHGSMGRHHARILSGLDGVQFVGVADPSPSASLTRPDLLVDSLDELMARRLDYCVLAAPTSEHVAVAVTLANAGIATLIEKPLGVDAVAASEIRRAFVQRGVKAGVGHVERFNAAFQEARRRISAGDLGAIRQVSTRRQSHFPGRISDVGVTKDLATHDVDITSWLCGSEYERVSATIAQLSDTGHEDAMLAIADLRNGVLVNHVVNWISPFKERVTTVTGDLGTFIVDSLTSDLTFFMNGSVNAEWDYLANFRGASEGDVVRLSFPKPEPLWVEHAAFRDFVLGVGDEVVSLDEGLRTLEVVDAILVSAGTGETVSLTRTGQEIHA